MRTASTLLGAAAALGGCLLTGCAGTGGAARPTRAPLPAPPATGKPACFQVRDVHDFTVLDRSNLIVYAPNEANAYQVRISPPATELRFAEGLSFLPATGRICGYAGDRLLLGPAHSAERFVIIDVSRLSPGSLEALRSGQDQGSAPAAQPRPGPGEADGGEEK